MATMSRAASNPPSPRLRASWSRIFRSKVSKLVAEEPQDLRIHLHQVQEKA
jgi:hypothetical protein